MRKIFSVVPITMISVFASCTANSASIYDNNASALNINMLTQNLMNYTHHGENMSQLFANKKIYGTMTRFDEYGDDGSTLAQNQVNRESDKSLFKNVWANAEHINARAHYAPLFSERARYDLFTIGTETKNIDLTYGNINFGGFIGYITGDMRETDANGNYLGLFTHYNYQDFDITGMVNSGSINNNSESDDFTNAWFNVAIDASFKIQIDKTLYFQPNVYAGYAWVSSDNLYINGDNVSTKNFTLFNVAPGARFVKNIIGDWYGSMSVKYMATFGDDKDIFVNGIKQSKVALDNYIEAGMDIEYDYEQFVFTGAVHKQIGGFDGWIGNINIKYLF